MTDRPEFNAEIEELAELIIPCLPEVWEKTCILFEDYDMPESFGIDSYCLVDGQKVPVEFSSEEVDSLVELFGIIQQKCRGKWKTARLELTCEGKFKFNFEY